MSARVRTKTEAAYLLSERRKDEMLRECLEAFVALYTAESARNYVRLITVPHTCSRAELRFNSQKALGDLMIARLRKFLGDEK